MAEIIKIRGKSYIVHRCAICKRFVNRNLLNYHIFKPSDKDDYILIHFNCQLSS
jgi:hypothetical protein